MMTRNESFIRPWLSLGEAQMIFDSLDKKEGAQRAVEIVVGWLYEGEDEDERRYSVKEMLAIQDTEGDRSGS